MTERTQIRGDSRRDTATAPGRTIEEPASQLLEQVRAWENVARQAHEDCLNMIDVEQEVLRRRNRSGQ